MVQHSTSRGNIVDLTITLKVLKYAFFFLSPREVTAVHLPGDATVPQKPSKRFAHVGRTVEIDVPFPNRLVKTTFKPFLPQKLT